MACNISKCTSSEEKLTTNFLDGPSKKTYLEVNDFSTKTNFSIESTKDANTVLRSSESNLDFITSSNQRLGSDLASVEFAIKRKADNTSSTIKKTYQCHICKEISFNRTSFIRHYKSHSARNLFVCGGDSQNVISHEEQLVRNKRTLSLEKEFACNICEKRFNHNSLLNRHYQIHTNKRPFGCGKCKKAFKQKSHLTQHYRMHTNEKPFVCDICGKRYTQKNSLVVHERTHTGEKPYECNVCEKRFNHKSSLVTHQRFHTGEKPYACDVCKKIFSQASYLVNHNRIHTNERPFVCDICKKAFNWKHHLTRHCRIHTKEKAFVF